ncbi:MAG: hypothetical protein R3346_01320 [Candidatus Spechtbacterales bacterium]|nr:hypothetical protein [Candidatus Spechtbacterales bacterium]
MANPESFSFDKGESSPYKGINSKDLEEYVDSLNEEILEWIGNHDINEEKKETIKQEIPLGNYVVIREELEGRVEDAATPGEKEEIEKLIKMIKHHSFLVGSYIVDSLMDKFAKDIGADEARQIIESLGLEETEPGKYMEGQPMPTEKELKEPSSDELDRPMGYIEGWKRLEDVAIEWLYRAEVSKKEKELLEQDILSGNFEKFILFLESFIDLEEDDNKKSKAKSILQRLQARLFARKKLEELKTQFSKNKENDQKYREDE